MSDRKYTKDHEWIDVSGGEATIGISDYAQDQLGDVVYVDLPDVGQQVEKGAEADGWFYRMKLSNMSDLDGLMDAEAYAAYLEALD